MLNLPFTPDIALVEDQCCPGRWNVSLRGGDPEPAHRIDCPSKTIAEWLADLLKSRLAQERKEAPYLSYLRAIDGGGVVSTCATCVNWHPIGEQPGQFGRCGQQAEEWPPSKGGILLRSHDDVTMFTGPEFGCARHKRRPTTPSDVDIVRAALRPLPGLTP